MDTKDIICQNIRAAIINVALKEEAILRQAGKGIFFMPELAFAYEVGKEIYFNRKSILFNENYVWKREGKVGQGYGIADLIFENKNDLKDTIVIEFKVLNKEGEFERDIIKLQKLPDHYLRLFCALEDIFVKDSNMPTSRRIFRVSERHSGLKPIVKEPFFFSTASNYQQPVFCSVELWRVE
jgi:hypothetical protein